jgi:hypothetical protein
MAATDSPERTATREAERPTTTVTPRHEAPATGEKSGKATAALILGILSIPAAIFPILGLPIGLVGLVLALVARGEIKRRPVSNAGTAKTALILCCIGLILTVISMIGGVIIATS